MLRARSPDRTNILAAILARATTSGDYEASTVLSAPATGVFAGIAAVGDEGNATGLAVHESRLVLWRCDKGRQRLLADVAAPKGGELTLRLRAAGGNRFRFSASGDDRTWIDVGDPQAGDQLPPWDRSIRIALTVGGGARGAAIFEKFEMRSTL